MNERLSVNRAKLAGDPFVDVAEAMLIRRVLEAVSAVDDLIPVSAREDFKPVQIVTLLTFCYARGIYSSEEIESRLDETSIAYICAGVKPDWHTLRQFRRQNVYLLIESLAHLLKLVGYNGGLTGNPHDEARRRIQMAIQTDSMTMDQ